MLFFFKTLRHLKHTSCSFKCIKAINQMCLHKIHLANQYPRVVLFVLLLLIVEIKTAIS